MKRVASSRRARSGDSPLVPVSEPEPAAASPERCRFCGSDDLYPKYSHIRIVAEARDRPRFRTLWACDRCRAYWSCLPGSTGSPDYYRDKLESDHALLEKCPRRFRRVRRAVEGALGKRRYRLLDVGCANGAHFDAYSEEVEKFGVEPSTSSAEPLRRRGVVRLGPSIDDAPSESFDAVTCLDVLEHVEDPRRLLDGIDRCLKPGGVVAIVTGDVDSLPARLGRRRWLYIALPEHCSFYSVGVLRTYWIDERGYEPLLSTRIANGFGVRYLARFALGTVRELIFRALPGRTMRRLEDAGRTRFPFFCDNMFVTFRKPPARR